MTDRERDEQAPRHVEAPNTMGTLSGFGSNQVAGEIDRQPTDRRIHEEVCTILIDNAQVPIQQLGVAVSGGVVTLSGTPRDEHTRQRAADLVAMIAGVKGVRNELTVSS